MPIFANCEFCGKAYRFKDAYAGRTLPCKECGADIDVPGNGSSRDELNWPPQSTSSQRPWQKESDSNLADYSAYLKIALCVVIAFVLLVAASSFFAPTKWQPDPNLVGKLGPERALGPYAISPPEDVTVVQSGSGRGNRTVWIWRDSSMEFEVSMQVDPAFKGITEPTIETKTGTVFLSSGVDPAYMLPGASIDHGTIHEMPFTRAIFEFGKHGATVVQSELKKWNCFYITYDGDTRIEIIGKCDEPADSQTFQILETAARSFRKLKDGEELASPTPDTSTVAISPRQEDRSSTTPPTREATSPPTSTSSSSSSSSPMTTASTRAQRSATPRTPSLPAVTPKPRATLPRATTQPEPRKPDIVWGHQEDVKGVFYLPRGGGTPVTYASQNGPYVAIDRTIYRVDTQERIGSADEHPPDRNCIRALSPDGKHLAVGAPMNQGSAEIKLISIETGRLTQTFRYAEKPNPMLRFLSFADSTRLLAGFNSQMLIWDITTGDEQHISSKYPVFSKQFITFDRSGKLLAVASTSGISLYDLAENRIISTITVPPIRQRLAIGLCHGLSFSPDDEELAMLLQDRVLVWDRRGKMLANIPVCIPPYDAMRPLPIQWLPNAGAMLLGGSCLVDRETETFIWYMRNSINLPQIPIRLLGEDRILAFRWTAPAGELVAVPIPWDLIRTTLTTMKTPGNAFLQPGQSVTLDVQVGNVCYADATEVTAKLTQSITDRLQDLHLGVADGASTICRMEYSEQTGRNLFVVNQRVFDDYRENAKPVQETVSNTKITLIDRQTNVPFWSKEFATALSIVLVGEPTAANARSSNFSSVRRQIDQLEIPSYVPKDPNGHRLPIITQLVR